MISFKRELEIRLSGFYTRQASTLNEDQLKKA